MPRKNSPILDLIPFLFVFLWSTGFIAAKYALPFVEPFYLLFIRMVLTVGIFLLLCIIFRVKWLSPRQAGHQMITGFLVHGAYLGGVFAAIKWGMPAGIAAIIVGIQPIMTAFFGYYFFKTSLYSRQWLGFGLGLVGVTTVLLSNGQQLNAPMAWPSVVAALSALMGISLGTIYQKRFGTGANLLAGLLWQYVSAALLMGILAWTFESCEVIWDRQLILALGWLIFGLSITAVLLLMYMIREGEPAKVASYFYLVPPAAAIEAWILFDESLSLLGVGAIAVTVFGVYLVIRKP